MKSESLPATLSDFARQAWPVVEPATEFISGWHLDCIAEHLEAVTRREIRNLVVNIPPRHMKSLLVAVFWPMWVWTTQPASRWLFNSYADTLSVRDSLKCRRIIQSPWYQERWGSVFQLAGDQNMKTRFENDKTGYRIAASVGGSNTGEGGDFVIADDPHNVLQGESDSIREGVLTWWDEVMSTRLNDLQTGCRVIVMQRVHEDDLSGHVLQRGGYHHLCLPAEYEPRTTIVHPGDPMPHDDCPFGSDPRTKAGELLWPERIGEDALASLKIDLGTYGVSGQLQQRPVPREGAMFQSDWFRPLPAEFDQMAARIPRVQFLDLAFSEKQSADYTAACTVSIDQAGNCYITNVWRERIDEKALPAVMANHVAMTKPQLLAVEEGAFKHAETRDFIRLLLIELRKRGVALAVTPIPVTTDKVFRAQLPSSRAKLGMIFADRGAPWWQPFEAELLRFPKGAHDDQVDALSGAVQLAIEKAPVAPPKNESYQLSSQPQKPPDWIEQAFGGRDIQMLGGGKPTIVRSHKPREMR